MCPNKTISEKKGLPKNKTNADNTLNFKKNIEKK